MRLQRRDALLLAPMLVIALATAVEMIVPAAWIDFVVFTTAPMSGLPILAYLWLEHGPTIRRPVTRRTCVARGPLRHETAADGLLAPVSGSPLQAAYKALTIREEDVNVSKTGPEGPLLTT
jgi:hypothetical protein